MQKLALLMSMMMASSAFANVTLHVPGDVDLVVTNMKQPKLEGGLFASNKTAQLVNGENQIVFQYEPVFDSRDRVEKVYSKTIIATFSAQDTELNFQLPQYKNASIAQKEIATMTWALVDKHGNTIPMKTDSLNKKGVMINRNYVQETQQYNEEGGVAAIAVSYVVATQSLPAATSVSTTNSSVAKPVTDSNELQQLKAWYLKAGLQDQKTFRKWLIDQE